MGKIDNKYKLCTMGKKGQKVTKEIDEILEKAVSDINKSIIMAQNSIGGLNAKKLGIGNPSTDTCISLKFQELLANRFNDLFMN